MFYKTEYKERSLKVAELNEQLSKLDTESGKLKIELEATLQSMRELALKVNEGPSQLAWGRITSSELMSLKQNYAMLETNQATLAEALATQEQARALLIDELSVHDRAIKECLNRISTEQFEELAAKITAQTAGLMENFVHSAVLRSANSMRGTTQNADYVYRSIGQELFKRAFEGADELPDIFGARVAMKAMIAELG